ncbi:hypothetical protein B0H63DRAFT_466444 [Podospora didyma]|uniref:Uncharacterized protein n=1 Tax=Podospora didyma TaxID=330526 RepID=A0AAE0P023_9PEZI|nr:hypothetical protein B0H63DRAFT_466444 [Podospora didyma]
MALPVEPPRPLRPRLRRHTKITTSSYEKRPGSDGPHEEVPLAHARSETTPHYGGIEKSERQPTVSRKRSRSVLAAVAAPTSNMLDFNFLRPFTFSPTLGSQKMPTLLMIATLLVLLMTSPVHAAAAAAADEVDYTPLESSTLTHTKLPLITPSPLLTLQRKPTAIPEQHQQAIIIPRAQSAGSKCPGSEGQWNCMGTSWQRCAAGQWSVEMKCAAGTRCAPSGFTYDFRVEDSRSNGANGVVTSAGGGGIKGSSASRRGAIGVAVLGMAVVCCFLMA